MSSLRDEIRAILREEFAALKAETGSSAPTCERVRISNGADLTRFAQDLVARAADPVFAAQVASGGLRFELARWQADEAIVSGPAKGPADVLDKALISERDIAAVSGVRLLRIGKRSCLTPLARDEARRRGIRIERSKA
ncbi:hypothetical protein [Sedimentitalea todarodis]|uniref:Uncharacterized protein n=1 Tax=Sedimentitalea todarodis TaxID=1631240 RepID=A0ABU3V8U5_9RHOB|nr:hypothetical protein [Sedimentitalea todarodis]MDU9002589.1 hypothetical protein [Sedimentitalea todarodis]